MFKNLTNFSYKRNWKEAIGFYLAYLFIGSILGGIVIILLYGNSIKSGATTFSEAFYNSLRLSNRIGGLVYSLIYSLSIAILLLIKKKLYKKFRYIILTFLSGILVVLGGKLLLGLIIPAFLTTKDTVSTEVPPVSSI